MKAIKIRAISVQEEGQEPVEVEFNMSLEQVSDAIRVWVDEAGLQLEVTAIENLTLPNHVS